MKHFNALTALMVCAAYACGGGTKPMSPATSPLAPVGSGSPTAAVPQVYVVNGGDSSISVLDPVKRQVTATFALGSAVKFPHHISLSPDRSTLMVAVPGMDFSMSHQMTMGGAMPPGAVLKVDTATGKVLANKVLPNMNHNVAFSPDGKEVWTSQMDMPGAVLVLDPTTLATISTIPVGHMPAEVTFSADGNFAFVANEMTDEVSIIDPSSKTVVKTISVPGGPVGAWPGSNNVMYVDSEEGKLITAISATSQTVLFTVQLGFTPGMAATAPDKSLWVTDSDNGGVSIFDAETGTKQADFKTGAGAHGLAFAADGKLAFVSNQTGNSISIVDVAQRATTSTIQVGSKPNGVAYIPAP